MKKILYLDMDGVLADFKSALAKQSKEVLEKYKGAPDEIPGIFAIMDPIPGAIEAVRTLATLFDIYILSTAPWWNPSAWADKQMWVKRYFGDIFYKKVILTHHKELNKGDFLVDDREKNGANRFEGELITFGSDKFPGWNQVVDYLVARQ